MKNGKPWVIAAKLDGKNLSLKVLSATLSYDLRNFCNSNFAVYIFDGLPLPEKGGKGKSDQDFWQEYFGEKAKKRDESTEFRSWVERKWNSALPKSRMNLITGTKIKQELNANEDTGPYHAIKLKLEMRICKS
jgi:hypothetical protein